MNDATLWRLALARQIGATYGINPNVAAVYIAGSVRAVGRIAIPTSSWTSIGALRRVTPSASKSSGGPEARST